MINKLMYFGTSTTQAGHYLWVLGESMQSARSEESSLGFYCEGLIQHKPDGSMNLVTINGLNIIAIAGSPYDKRPGSKSIFWGPKGTTFKELKEAMYRIPASKKILDTMPFKINWLFE